MFEQKKKVIAFMSSVLIALLLKSMYFEFVFNFQLCLAIQKNSQNYINT